MDTSTLRQVIAALPTAQPITDAFERRVPPTGRVWYQSQKEHLLGWLDHYDSGGAYDRKHPGQDARHFYTHFQCVQGLLWLAEALGEERDVLEQAARAAQDAGRNSAAQCGAFRRMVPWTRVESLLALGNDLEPGHTSALEAVVGRVRRAPRGQLLVPAAELLGWLGVADQGAVSQRAAMARLRETLKITPMPRRDAFYLEWVGD